MIIAILRITGLAALSFSDFQSTTTAPILYSILEPAIGISVACMPLLQPVVQNTWLGRLLAIGRGSNTGSSSAAARATGMGMGMGKRGYAADGRFERLGDEVPLAAWERGDRGPGGDLYGAGASRSASASGGGGGGRGIGGQITVKHEFSVHAV